MTIKPETIKELERVNNIINDKMMKDLLDLNRDLIKDLQRANFSLGVATLSLILVTIALYFSQ